MIKQIVAFGDSCTYGHGLIDCHKVGGDPGDKPSNLAWPNMLGKILDCPSYNLGIPGASNKEIWYKILNTKLDQDSTVIIGWSMMNRFSIIKSKSSVEQIGIWKKDKVSKSYFKQIEHDYDSNIDFFARANHIKLHLDSMGIENYHFKVEYERYKPIWNCVEFLDVRHYEIRQRNPLAEDNLHPGPAAHKQVAEVLHKLIAENRASKA